MNYGFVHQGRVYTPDGSTVNLADNDLRNALLNQQELAIWKARPQTVIAYYTDTTVTTWMGDVLGTITSRKVIQHNMGGRFIVLRVKATNGRTYHGRASYDNGNIIRLHRCKP